MSTSDLFPEETVANTTYRPSSRSSGHSRMASLTSSSIRPKPPERTAFAAPPLPRLFVGLELPPPVCSSISTLIEPDRISTARWLPASSWHITLHFLGATPMEDVHAALANVQAAPFTARLSAAGTFSIKDRPHVLWAGVPTTPGLTALHAAVRQALIGAGFRVEDRPFRPHVTLAKLRCRKKEDAETVNGFVRDHQIFEAPAFQVDSFTLFESVSNESGPLYVSRRRYPLSSESNSA